MQQGKGTYRSKVVRTPKKKKKISNSKTITTKGKSVPKKPVSKKYTTVPANTLRSNYKKARQKNK